MQVSVRRAVFALSVGLVALGTAFGAAAQAPAEIAQRQELMKANGGAMRVLTPMARGDVPWNAQAAGQAAASALNTATRAKALFPAGTGPDKGQTAALPVIWERKAEFEALFDRAAEAAGNLVRLASANDEAGFKAALPALGQMCGTCHTPFRRPAN
ncbi:MAG: cytochrome c [Proteobacteria bacterium]|nr:cytochrome c [Pseudomonadota bacterium]